MWGPGNSGGQSNHGARSGRVEGDRCFYVPEGASGHSQSFV